MVKKIFPQRPGPLAPRKLGKLVIPWLLIKCHGQDWGWQRTFVITSSIFEQRSTDGCENSGDGNGHWQLNRRNMHPQGKELLDGYHVPISLGFHKIFQVILQPSDFELVGVKSCSHKSRMDYLRQILEANSGIQARCSIQVLQLSSWSCQWWRQSTRKFRTPSLNFLKRYHGYWRL